MTRRRQILLAIGGVAAVSVVATYAAGWWDRTNGPIPVEATIEVSFDLVVDEVGTWGIPIGGGAVPVTLRSINAENVEGLEVIDVALCRSSSEPDAEGILKHCAPIDRGWPPPGVALLAVDGTVLAPGDRTMGLLIGFRRTRAGDDSEIDGVRIRYEAGGITYEVLQPWSLRLVDPSG